MHCIVFFFFSFRVADHDFSKLSLIPDAIFVQDIPKPQHFKPADEYLHDDSKNSWLRGQIYHGVKNMVTQASTALTEVAEMGKILDFEGSQAFRVFAITDDLFAQKSLIGLFLRHDMDEVLVCRPAAGLSCSNPVERVHAIANFGLQSVGIMRQKMSADMEERIINRNSNEELRKAIERHEELKPALGNSSSVSVDLLNSVFTKLSLNDKRFQTFSPCTGEELTNYHLSNNRFDENISELKKKEHLKNLPKFNEFLRTHTTRRTCYLHVFKCSTDDCPFFFLLRERKKLKALVIQYRTMMTKATSIITREKTQKKNSFPLSWKILPKGFTVSLSHHRRKRHSTLEELLLVQSVTNHDCCILEQSLRSWDHLSVLNDFQFVSGSVFQDIMVDKNNPDEAVLSKVFARENISCKFPLNCPITLAKYLSKYAFNVVMQVSWLLTRSITRSVSIVRRLRRSRLINARRP